MLVTVSFDLLCRNVGSMTAYAGFTKCSFKDFPFLADATTRENPELSFCIILQHHKKEAKKSWNSSGCRFEIFSPFFWRVEKKINQFRKEEIKFVTGIHAWIFNFPPSAGMCFLGQPTLTMDSSNQQLNSKFSHYKLADIVTTIIVHTCNMLWINLRHEPETQSRIKIFINRIKLICESSSLRCGGWKVEAADANHLFFCVFIPLGGLVMETF